MQGQSSPVQIKDLYTKLPNSANRIRVVSPVCRFAGSFRPESFRPGFMGGSFCPY